MILLFIFKAKYSLLSNILIASYSKSSYQIKQNGWRDLEKQWYLRLSLVLKGAETMSSSELLQHFREPHSSLGTHIDYFT